MKYKLTLRNTYPANVTPCELEGEYILCNDVSFPREIDPDVSSFADSKLYVIGHEHGPICAVWASCEQYALDTAVDANMLDCLMSEEQDYENESLTPLGNAGELFDLQYAWIGEVEFKAERDIQLIVKMVRAYESGMDNLAK